MRRSEPHPRLGARPSADRFVFWASFPMKHPRTSYGIRITPPKGGDLFLSVTEGSAGFYW